MATLISCATGNFTAAATWELVDSTSALDVETGNEELGTAYTSSAAFTPGAITVDGIAIKLTSTLASPTGTISVQLYNSSSSTPVAGTEVTINASDVASSTSGSIGWVFFKFSAPVTLLAATNYTVQAKESVATDNVFVYRNGTVANYCRLLRTTTTQAPAAGDKMLVLGEWTAVGTKTDRAVTMDSTAITDYGTASTTIESFGIGKGGTLTWGTAASTNYNLRLSGLLKVYDSGTYNMGTTGTPMPSTSTAKLEFDCAADGDFGLVAKVNATINVQGAARTADRCMLNTDEAVAQTILGVDTNTGWVNGDEIAIAPTARTAAQYEKRTVSSSDATTVTISSGLTYAHSGISPTQADVILLTRNVKICSVSSSFMAYFYCEINSTADIDWAEFYYVGTITSGKYGLQISTGCNVQRCSIHDGENYLSANSGGTFSYNVLYSTTGTMNYQTSGTNSYNIIIGGTTGISTGGSQTFSYCKVSGASGTGISTSANQGSTYQNCTIHTCGSYGLSLYSNAACAATVTDCTIWRNVSYGIYINATTQESANGSTFTNLTMFGNTTANVFFACGSANFTFTNFTSNSEASYATATGISVAASFNAHTNMRLISCSFGATTAHTQSILLPGSESFYSTFVQIIAENCVFAGTEVSTGYQYMRPNSYISSQKHDQTAATHKTWTKYGILSLDSSVYNTAAPSLLMEPKNATNKLESAPLFEGMKAAVASGNTITASVYVRKNASYTGNQPRLIVKANVAAGISSDTVLDTMTVGASTWEQLSGTTAAITDDATLEFIVDCDGTAGGVNVDDWSVS